MEETGELMECTGPEEAIEAPRKSEQMHRKWTELSQTRDHDELLR
jgi:hypothetical protein